MKSFHDVAAARRATLSKRTTVAGTGLHGGRESSVSLIPAAGGIVFTRNGLLPTAVRDLEVVATERCTRVKFPDGSFVDTVEHLMAALAMSGITDVVVDFSGDEVPILDGSAAQWLAAVERAQTRLLPGAAPAFVVTSPFEFSSRGATYSVAPGPLSYDVTIDFPTPVIGRQRIVVAGGEIASLADSRTFAMEHEIAALRNAGLAKGGGLHNAVVVGAAGPLNPEGFRHPDECVRHKTLDLVGDLHMAGAPVIGKFVVSKPGHSANGDFLKAMLDAGAAAPLATLAAAA
jgi:UDP-3-O-[3-hydroxymyristoyl] N-acetylglucosamine deacetylase